MMQETIYDAKPKQATGDCFQVAGNLIMDNSEFTLVHAYVSGQDKLKGKKIRHAWIEINNCVIDCSNGKNIATSKKKYYAVAKPIKIKKFDSMEASLLMLKTHNFGNWTDEEIKAMRKARKKVAA